MKYKIGISPCPNDTYIFEAIYSKKIGINNIEFEFVFEDVQTLNQMASKNEIDIVKISYAHYFSVLQNYILFTSGSALGKGVGPLLISKREIEIDNIINCNIAIPGKMTTAYFLLHYCFPFLKNTVEMSFEKIENAILNNVVDAGVIIHENRFTYQQKGLKKIIDLGEYWEQKTNLPIPLGGIAIKRNIDTEIQQSINQLIQQSIEIANENKSVLNNFIKNNAQEMDEIVMKKHINLYVNDYSIHLNEEAKKAIYAMKELLNNDLTLNLFVK